MTGPLRIPLGQSVLAKNDAAAARTRGRLAELGLPCVNLMGSPGCGKTALLEATLDALAGELRVGVVTGDLATARDADRLRDRAAVVTQINTGGGCHLDAAQVAGGLAGFPLEDLDLVVVENVGNLICPATFDLGEARKVVVFSTPEGQDKPAKHPSALLAADLVLLNKVDLLPYLPFDVAAFRADVALVRADLDVLEVAATRKDDDPLLGPWLTWLRGLVTR